MICHLCQAENVPEGAQFCPSCGGSLMAKSQEERRKGVVLFGDISGFTALSEKMDPDDLREVIDSLMKRLVEIVKREGGLVDKIIGDCIMALFGIEKAYGDDTQRALATGVLLQKEVLQFNRERGTELDIHTGMAFGLVSFGVVGTDRTVMGDTVNTAARLMSLAQDGQTLVTENLFQLENENFEFQAFPPTKVKGKSEALRPYLLLEKREKTIKLDRPFVGRKKELQKLEAIWKEVSTSGRARTLLLRGPSGIGKSRLLQAFLSQKGRVTQARFDDGDLNPFMAFSGLARRILIERETGGEESADLLFAKDVNRWLDLSQTDLRTFLNKVAHNYAKEGPVIFVFEDLHYASPASLQLLEDWRKANSDVPILFLLTSRLEYSGKDEELELKGFSSTELKELASEWGITDEKQNKDLLSLSQGNPLFIEEFLYAQSQGAIERVDPDAKLELLIGARFDRLSVDAQDLAKKMAIFGRRSKQSWMKSLSKGDLSSALHELEKRDLVFRAGNSETLVFRHDRIRDTVYERIPLKPRQDLHEEAAELLANAEEPIEKVARHYLLSGNKRKALNAALLAARKLINIENSEECALLTDASLQLAEELEDDEQLVDAIEIDFVRQRDQMNDQEATAYLQRALDETFAQKKGLRGRLLLLRANYDFVRGRYQDVEDALASLDDLLKDRLSEDRKTEAKLLRAKNFYRLGERKKAVRPSMEVLQSKSASPTDRGEAANILGTIAYADQELQTAEEMYKKAQGHFESAGNDRGLLKAYGNLGNIAFLRKDYGKAIEFYEACLTIEKSLGDFTSQTSRYVVIADTYRLRGNLSLALENFEKAEELVSLGLGEHLFHEVRLKKGYLFLFIEDHIKVRENALAARKFFESVGHDFLKLNAGLLASWSSQEEGHFDKATKELETCIQEIKEKGDVDRKIEIDAYHQKARLLLRQGKVGAAELVLEKLKKSLSKDSSIEHLQHQLFLKLWRNLMSQDPQGNKFDEISRVLDLDPESYLCFEIRVKLLALGRKEFLAETQEQYKSLKKSFDEIDPEALQKKEAVREFLGIQEKMKAESTP